MIYRLTFAVPDVDGTVELVVPDTGPVRFEAQFSGEAIGDGFVVVRDAQVPRARTNQLEFRADGLWIDVVCETRDEHWSFGLEAFGLRVEDPTDDIGDRIPVGYDLEWETPDQIHGELLIGRAVVPITASGMFQITA